jgi:gamma-glutamyl:cysteine ligase YbdK (ATP-grasp superfamily)
MIIGRRLLSGLGGLFLLGVMLIGAGGTWLTHNTDTLAEAAVDASGIKDAVTQARDANCRRARDEYDRLWDRAVESATMETAADALERVEAEVRSICPANQ